MATRMQQRRGTAQQWLDADPVLAAGEIGFETDTNEFRIGDGVNVWSDLSPFKNLEDLGGSLDDYILVTSRGAADGVAPLNANGQIPVAFLSELITDAPEALNTLGEISDLLTTVETSVGSSISAHSADTTNVHGIADTSLLATEAEAETIAGTVVAGHNSDTTNVHGIADTTVLATTTDVNTAQTSAQNFASGEVNTHGALTENVHGIADTAALATATDVSDAVSDHNGATTTVHGIANTALLETQTGAQNKADAAAAAAILAAASAADTKVSDHNADTTSVHGIADTSALATKTYADGAVSTAVAALTKSSVGLGNVDNTSDANKPVSTATQTELDLKAPLANPTFTGTVSGVTKSMVDLANVDNTSDANKPVSTATQTALDLKADLAGPTFTGTVVLPSTTSIGNVSATELGYVDGVTSSIQTQIDSKAAKAGPTFTGTLTAADVTVTGNLTVSGTTTTISTANLNVTDPMIYMGDNNSANLVDLGFVSAFNDGTYQHSGLVRDSSDSKWKLFKGVTDEPTTTVNFTQGSLDALAVGAFEATSATIGNVSNTELQYLDGVTSAVQTQIDAKAPSSSPTLATPTITGALTLSSSGVVFTDGTQTKAGVPSITAFATAISTSATLASGQQDKFVPLTGAVQITLPATGYSTGQSIDFYQESGTGASFALTNGVVGTPGLKFRTTNSVVTAMKTSSGWLVFGDLSA